MKLELAILGGAALIAASILFIERWQISAVGYGSGSGDTASSEETIYRLDRWTGRIDLCALGGSDPMGFFQKLSEGGPLSFDCAATPKNHK